MKEFNNLLNEDNKTILIGLLSILVTIWVILYLIPTFLSSLFNTILGNLILLLFVILVSSRDIKYGSILAIILIILYRFAHFKEGFTWTDDSTTQFIKLQNSINPQLIFDTNEIQKQATQEDVNHFLKNGEWLWSTEVEDLYKKALSKNPYVRLYPDDAVKDTKTKYNQTIIMQILSDQEKSENSMQTLNAQNKDQINDRDGLGSYSFTSGLNNNNT
jgi:hypothetical protein